MPILQDRLCAEGGGGMLKTIQEIGIFMIAAQAVVHFAPSVQYEKYIKSISGVIILLLFLKPFLQLAGGMWEEPEEILKRMTELTDLPDLPETVQTTCVGDVMASRMEKEIMTLLNQDMEEEPCYVMSVVVRLEEEQIPFVEITIGKKEKKDLIVVEEITIGEAKNEEKAEEEQVYRQKFAGLLGIPEENVEVKMDGRG